MLDLWQILVILAFNSCVPGNSNLLGDSGGGFVLWDLFFSLMDGPSCPEVLEKLSFIIEQQKKDGIHFSLLSSSPRIPISRDIDI